MGEVESQKVLYQRMWGGNVINFMGGGFNLIQKQHLFAKCNIVTG